MKAILIVVNVEGKNNTRSDYEMSQMLEALNIEVISVLEATNNRGEGHHFLSFEELIMLTIINYGNKADCIVVNHDLTSQQINHLEMRFSLPVYDRNQTIINSILFSPASKGASLRIHIAKLRYQKRKLVTIYLKKGEDDPKLLERKKQISMFRVRINEELKRSVEELKILQKKQRQTKQARIDSELPNVALIGYTNAGKSTLMNALLRLSHQKDDKMVQVKDNILTTIDTVTRLIDIDGYPPFFVTDTMGFFDNSPKELEIVYQSTYDAISEADTLVNIVDMSFGDYARQVQVITNVLESINQEDTPYITLYNKCDKLSAWPFIPDADSLFVSLSNDEDIDDIIKMIFEIKKDEWEWFTLILPYEKSLYKLKKEAYVTLVKEVEEGYYVEGYMIPSRFRSWSKFML